MLNYKILKDYTGSLYNERLNTNTYNGIEYDVESPNNKVIGSPGGVAGPIHHYTKGFYGKGGSSSDIYAGDGYRYISGEYGNLYTRGHNAFTTLNQHPYPNDTRYWENMSDYNHIQPDIKENFSKDFEFVNKEDNPSSSFKIKITQPIIIVILFIIFIIIINFWGDTFSKFLTEKIFKSPINWTESLIVAILLSILFGILLSFTNLSIAEINAV